jgi:hypothetical protein
MPNAFFSAEIGVITELNAKGIATILTFAGYRVIDLKDYPDFKRRIKRPL